MNPTVEALLVLQDRDTRVAHLTSDLAHLPQQIAQVEAELATRTATFDELKARTRQIEADRKKLDLDVQAKQAAIARYRSQQQQTRKNEEFAALNHEIEHAEKEIAALEDGELELMDKRADLEKRGAATSAELIGAKEKLAEAEKVVPEDALTRYRRILKSKKDVAIVPLQHGSCGGCHMKVTSQTALSAKGGDQLVSCDNCGRLVYWLDE